MHIKSFGLRELRKLNLNHDYHDPDFKITNIHHYQISKLFTPNALFSINARRGST